MKPVVLAAVLAGLSPAVLLAAVVDPVAGRHGASLHDPIGICACLPLRLAAADGLPAPDVLRTDWGVVAFDRPPRDLLARPGDPLRDPAGLSLAAGHPGVSDWVVAHVPLAVVPRRGPTRPDLWEAEEGDAVWGTRGWQRAAAAAPAHVPTAAAWVQVGWGPADTEPRDGRYWALNPRDIGANADHGFAIRGAGEAAIWGRADDRTGTPAAPLRPIWVIGYQPVSPGCAELPLRPVAFDWPGLLSDPGGPVAGLSAGLSGPTAALTGPAPGPFRYAPPQPPFSRGGPGTPPRPGGGPGPSDPPTGGTPDPSPVPVPGAIWLLLAGLGGLGAMRVRRGRA